MQHTDIIRATRGAIMRDTHRCHEAFLTSGDLDIWPLNVHFVFLVFCMCLLLVFLLGASIRNRRRDRQTDGQTDGRARRLMRPIGRPHNKQTERQGIVSLVCDACVRLGLSVHLHTAAAASSCCETCPRQVRLPGWVVDVTFTLICPAVCLLTI